MLLFATAAAGRILPLPGCPGSSRFRLSPLGVVIQGATPHAEFINQQASSGLGAISRDMGVPVICGIVTADNLEQALKCGGTRRGVAPADAAIEMANLVKEMA